MPSAPKPNSMTGTAVAFSSVDWVIVRVYFVANTTSTASFVDACARRCDEVDEVVATRGPVLHEFAT